jgi:hypothetical protein
VELSSTPPTCLYDVPLRLSSCYEGESINKVNLIYILVSCCDSLLNYFMPSIHTTIKRTVYVHYSNKYTYYYYLSYKYT